MLRFEHCESSISDKSPSTFSLRKKNRLRIQVNPSRKLELRDAQRMFANGKESKREKRRDKNTFVATAEAAGNVPASPVPTGGRWIIVVNDRELSSRTRGPPSARPSGKQFRLLERRGQRPSNLCSHYLILLQFR